MSDEEIVALVIDNGSGFMKGENIDHFKSCLDCFLSHHCTLFINCYCILGGIAVDDAPRSVFPSVVGRPRTASTVRVMNTGLFMGP